MLRVLVCGGRDYIDKEKVHRVLSLFTNATIISGKARGADSLAATVANELGLPLEEYPANWGRYGKGAGPIRNQEMLDTGIDLVIAFPGGVGTHDMKKRAKSENVLVFDVW